ncbi:MAG: MFS transporter, partial [Aquabacterium sp.]
MTKPLAPTHAAAGFRRVLAAEVVSNFGTMLSRLAIPWLAAITLAATPWQMSALLMADVAAGALGALLLGAWVDRRPKRATMVACDLLNVAVLSALALAAWQQRLSIPVLAAAAALSGLLTMTFELARSAWIAQAVPEPDLPRRNAQLSVGGSLSETAAFAAGGWLFQGLGAALSLAVDALSYAVSAFALRGVREVPPVPAAADAPAAPGGAIAATLRDLRRGLAEVRRQPMLRRLAALELLLGLSMALFSIGYLLYLSRELQLGTGLQGMIIATGGLGSVLGGLLAVRAGQRLGSPRALALGLLLAAAGSACGPAAQGAGLVAVLLLVAHQVVGDGGMTVAQVHDRTLRQTLVAPDLLAAVDGALRAVGQVAMLAGALLAATVATELGLRNALWLAAGLSLLAAVVAVAGRRADAQDAL